MKRTMINGMVSPLTGGRVSLVEDIEIREFRKEKYYVHVRYYICEDTGEKFNTIEQGDLTCNELYNQYRVKHGIPFPDEIKKIREKYGLSYAQMTKIVGFGQNQWRQYEHGQVPSESNGKSIVAVSFKSGMMNMLNASREEFSNSEFERILTRVAASQEYDEDEVRHILFYGKGAVRSLYNGYSPMIVSKLEAMVRLLVHNEKEGVTKTKLNKEMFYADFLHYRHYGRSISGLQYKAIQRGPVPVHYDTVYDNVEGLQREEVETDDIEYVILKCVDPDIVSLDEDEKRTVSEVSERMSPLSLKEVVNISHNEDSWLRHKDNHGMIPYSEAFLLKEFV